MKKLIAIAVGVAVALSATSASAATVYTRDLTMGSTGADVVSLQTTLESKGFLVIPTGVAKGYFGALTKSALAKYQASVGIAPAVGYFGPVTRAHFNAMSDDMSGGDDTDNGSDSDLQGGEGDIRDYDILGNPSNTDLDEGETDEVLGFEFEARDSDLRVERVEILASSSDVAAGASNEPWDYIESARLMMGSKEVAEISNLDDEDSWDEEDDDQYSFRFEDIEAVVDEDETAKFYVEFTAVDNLDSDDEGTEFDVSVNDDGIRVVDAEGIDIYEGDASDTRTVSFQGAEAGDLEMNLDEEDNQDRLVFVDEDTDTDGVEIIRFTLEANASDNTIDELQVLLATSTATNTQISEVVKSLRLEVDGDEISSESVPSGTGTSTITFEDLEDDFQVAEDEEVEVVVYADLDAQEGNYGEGYEFYAYVPGSGIEAEDAEGDDVTVSDNVTGGEIELRVNGITVEFVSGTVDNVFTADESNESSIKTFNLKFEVSAEGDDLYIDKSVQNVVSPSSSGAGVAWALTSDTNATTTATSTIFSASGSTTGDTAGAFKVAKGNSRTFTLAITLTAGQQGSIGVQLTGVNWDTDSSVGTDYYTQDLDDFKIDPVFFTKIQ